MTLENYLFHLVLNNSDFECRGRAQRFPVSNLSYCGECEVRLQAASLKHRVKSLWLGFSCPPNSAPATCTLLWGKEVFHRVVRELCVRELCWPWWQRTGVLQHQLAVHTFWCTLWVRVEEQDLYKAVHQWIDCWMQQQATRAVRLRVRQTQKMALYICQ